MAKIMSQENLIPVVSTTGTATDIPAATPGAPGLEEIANAVGTIRFQST